MNPGPLAGRRVVITRAAHQADELVRRLRDLGAEPLVVPLIEIAEPADGGRALAGALADLQGYDWLVVTSPNGATRVADRLREVRALAGGRHPLVAAVGTATAAALDTLPDLVAARQIAEALVEQFPDGTGRVLVAQADAARPTVAEGLAAKGWHVDTVVAYRTVGVRATADQREAVANADAVLFASGSAVRSWVDVFGRSTPAAVVAIGPVTAQMATELGLKVHAVATDHSLGGMLTSLLTLLTGSD